KMVADHLKEKFESQIGELYRSLGEFVVNFEHLMFAAKNKINLLCGLGKENVLLLEPYSARQTIELLNTLIQDRIELGRTDPEDASLFRQLVSDLRTLNTERNKCVHTMWFIGWHSDKDTDFSEARGMTWSALRKFKQQTI